MASQITSAVLLAAIFAVLIMVCAAVGEGQRPVPLNTVNKQGMRPVHKEMKGTKGMRPTVKNMKVVKGMKPTLKVVSTQMPPKFKMPPMPGMPPMPDMPPMATPPSSSSFTYPSLAVGFLALVAVFCA